MSAVLVLVLGALLALGSLCLALRGWLRPRKTEFWVTTCPTTKEPAIIAIAPRDSTCPSPRVQRYLRLKDCSVWPKRQDCGRECLLALGTETLQDAARK